jgi:hypothetical protein
MQLNCLSANELGRLADLHLGERYGVIALIHRRTEPRKCAI